MMNRRFPGAMVSAVLSFFTGCTMIVNTQETTITAENDLRNLVANVGNDSYSVSYVNIAGVTIGDVYFNSINAGEVTAAMTTNLSGDVNISIGSAIAMVSTPQGSVRVTISDIEEMTTYIESGKDNAVVFDESSASVVLTSFQMPKQTSIVVKNYLEDLIVTIDGSTVNVEKIDLKDVLIGDVRFPSINSGKGTDTVTTLRSGAVDIDIGSAVVTVTTAQGTVQIELSSIEVMTTTVSQGSVNTVVFDEESAPVILSTLQDYLKTTISAKNELLDLEVTVNSSTSDIESIDLKEVSIGDVYFAEIDAGTTTGPQVTRKNGTVEISINSAEVSVVQMVLGQPVQNVFTFDDIDPMETIIEEYEANTVIFNETTAENIFLALVKRLASP